MRKKQPRHKRSKEIRERDMQISFLREYVVQLSSIITAQDDMIKAQKDLIKVQDTYIEINEKRIHLYTSCPSDHKAICKSSKRSIVSIWTRVSSSFLLWINKFLIR